MRPMPVTFHLYAESDEEIYELRSALYDLVSICYSEGIIVTAPKVTDAVRKLAGNPFLKQILK